MAQRTARLLPSLAFVAMAIASAGCCCIHEAASADFCRARNVTVALVRGKDKLTLIHLSNALAAEGIQFRAGGSASYGIDVPAHLADRARAVLERDGERKGYVVWIGGVARHEPAWVDVDLGPPPRGRSEIIGRYPETSVPGSVIASEDFLDFTDRKSPVVLTAMRCAPRDFIFSDGLWTTAYTVRVELSVAGTPDYGQFQLVPVRSGGYATWRDN